MQNLQELQFLGVFYRFRIEILKILQMSLEAASMDSLNLSATWLVNNS